MTVKANVLRILPVLAILLAACSNPPPPPPPSDPMPATSDGGGTPAGSVDLAPGEDANFNLVLGNVPQSFDVIVAELVTDQSAAIELRNGGYWGIISSSVSRDRFVRGRLGTVPPAIPSTQEAAPATVTEPTLQCQGPCIMIDPAGGSFYLRVVNTGGSQLSAQVYLYGWDLDDQNEPANDLRSGAVPLAEGESGALELLGDVDYWSATTDADVTISEPTGIEVEVSVYDTCGLAVAGPYQGGETFSVYQGESVRVRAAGEVAATAGRSRYFVTVDPFSGAPRPPGCQQVTANTSDTTPVGSVNLSGSGQAVFVLTVPSTVRNRDILQIEITKDAGLEVLASAGGAVLYSSHSRDYFAAGSLGSFSAPAVGLSAVGVHRACGGSCILIENPSSEYVVRVTNDGSSGTVALYAFGRDFDDNTEPANNDTSTAPIVTDDGEGAIEFIGDEDIWKVAFGGVVTFAKVSGAIDMVVDVYNQFGQHVDGPYPSGYTFNVYAGDYIVVRALDSSVAAVAAKSAYNLF